MVLRWDFVPFVIETIFSDENSKNRCEEAKRILIDLITQLRLSVKWEKVTGLALRMVLLGLVIVSKVQRLEFRREKLDQLVASVSFLKSKIE